jgi:hypothetical protein
MRKLLGNGALVVASCLLASASIAGAQNTEKRICIKIDRKGGVQFRSRGGQCSDGFTELLTPTSLASGATGATGAAGATGATGATGITGATGAQGETGPAGTSAGAVHWFSGSFPVSTLVGGTGYLPITGVTGQLSTQFENASLRLPSGCEISNFTAASNSGSNMTIGIVNQSSSTLLSCSLDNEVQLCVAEGTALVPGGISYAISVSTGGPTGSVGPIEFSFICTEVQAD